MDPMGGIVMTNDGNAILRFVFLNSCVNLSFFRDIFEKSREITVKHPAAKSMIEIARTQVREG